MEEHLEKFSENKIRESEYFRYDKESNCCFCKIDNCTASIQGMPGELLDRHISNEHKKSYLFYFSEKLSLDEDESLADRICDGLVELVVKNGRPISYFNDSGFLKIIEAFMISLPLKKRFLDISSSSIRNLVCNKIKKILIEEINGKILHAKVDAVRHDKKYFLAFHVQYFKETSSELKTLNIKELHKISLEEVEKFIFETMNSFNISSDNVFSFTIDDGSDILILKSNKPSIKVESGTITILDCLLGINNFKTINSITNLYKEIVDEVLTEISDEFIKAIILLNKKAMTLGIPESSLEWMNSITKSNLTSQPYWILVIELIDKINTNEKFDVNNVDNSDLRSIEMIFDCLIWVRSYMDQLLEFNYSLSEYYADWCVCKKGLTDRKCDFADRLLKYMNNKEEKILLQDDMLLASVFLDPRYKHLLPVEKTSRTVEYLIKLWEQLTISTKNKQNVTFSFQQTNQVRKSSHTDDPLDILIEKAEMELEILPYLNSFRGMPRSDFKINLFEYWEENKITQPILYKLAQIVNAVPASRFSLSRLFYGMKERVGCLKFDFDREFHNNFICISNLYDSSMFVFDKRTFY